MSHLGVSSSLLLSYQDNLLLLCQLKYTNNPLAPSLLNLQIRMWSVRFHLPHTKIISLSQHIRNLYLYLTSHYIFSLWSQIIFLFDQFLFENVKKRYQLLLFWQLLCFFWGFLILKHKYWFIFYFWSVNFCQYYKERWIHHKWPYVLNIMTLITGHHKRFMSNIFSSGLETSHIMFPSKELCIVGSPQCQTSQHETYPVWTCALWPHESTQLKAILKVISSLCNSVTVHWTYLSNF